MLTLRPRSALNHLHDLERPRVHYQDLVADADELIAAPLRIDGDDFPGKRVQVNAFARNAGANRDIEVDVVDRFDALIADHRGDLGALLARELGASAGLARRGLGLASLSRLGLSGLASSGLGLGRRLRLALRALLLLRIHVGLLTFAALGLHILAGLGAFVLRAHAFRLLTRGVTFFAAMALANRRLLAALGLHVLAGLGAFILRAHALWLLTRGVFFLAALALANGRRFLIRLCPFHARPGPGRFRSMSIGSRRRITTGWRALLRSGAA